MYKPTQTCFRSFPSACVQQSALDFCTTLGSRLAAVSEPELQYIAGLALVGQTAPQKWWLGFEMQQTGGNSSSWELVDLSRDGGDLSWMGLAVPSGEDWKGETKLCVVVDLKDKKTTDGSPWELELQSCTDKSGFLCTQGELISQV